MTTLAAPRVLSHVFLPQSLVLRRLVVAGLVVGFAGLTALAARITIPVPGTPVPISGQTFAVLLAGATLGTAAGSASQLLYVAAGLFFPVYAEGKQGWEVLSGATGGYLIGFVMAAVVVGYLAERRQDRSFATSIPAMLAGTAVIYLCGIPWLAREVNLSATDAIAAGFSPFVIGDALKLLAAGVLLPTSWKLVGRLIR